MRLRIAGVGLLFVCLAQSSFGGTITNGVFDISGTIYVTNAQSTPFSVPGTTFVCPATEACIFWQDSAGSSNDKLDITSTGLPNGNIPLALAGNDAANVSNLANPPEVVGGSGFTPTTFMTFNNAGITTDLMLSYIVPGIYSSAQCGLAPAVGQQCTTPGSLFNFVNNPPPNNGSCNGQCEATATWVFQGDTNTAGVTWTGNFTSQFSVGVPFQTVLAELTANGYVSNTFSAAITLAPAATTPEPGTLYLMFIGTGLLGLASFRRHRPVK
jgi:hypothetical protein